MQLAEPVVRIPCGDVKGVAQQDHTMVPDVLVRVFHLGHAAAPAREQQTSIPQEKVNFMHADQKKMMAFTVGQ